MGNLDSIASGAFVSYSLRASFFLLYAAGPAYSKHFLRKPIFITRRAWQCLVTSLHALSLSHNAEIWCKCTKATRSGKFRFDALHMLRLFYRSLEESAQRDKGLVICEREAREEPASELIFPLCLLYIFHPMHLRSVRTR